MANFVFPTPIYLGRRSVMNDLGLGTILGNGSPVSPRWTYYRERAWSDADDDTGRRGAAPNVEPPPGSPEFRAAAATLAAVQDAPQQPSAASAAAGALGIAAPVEWELGKRLAGLAARAAPR